MTDIVDTRSEAERKVKAVWPDAICWTHGIFSDRFSIYERPRNPDVEPFWGKRLSKTFHETEDEAWLDAASRLERKEPHE